MLISFSSRRRWRVYQGDAQQPFGEYARLFGEVDELAKRVGTATVIVFGHIGQELSTSDSPGMLSNVDGFLRQSNWVDA